MKRGKTRRQRARRGTASKSEEREEEVTKGAARRANQNTTVREEEGKTRVNGRARNKRDNCIRDSREATWGR